MARKNRYFASEFRETFNLDTEGFDEDSVFVPDTAEEVWIVFDEDEEEIARFQMHLAERRILASL